VVNLVAEQYICPLATANTIKNKNANQVARDLLLGKFKATPECPKTVLSY